MIPVMAFHFCHHLSVQPQSIHQTDQTPAPVCVLSSLADDGAIRGISAASKRSQIVEKQQVEIAAGARGGRHS
ncbi:hypothetical protein PLICRDRAFT_399302 [Plicaturopsis crispa FD-325 SS-3]|nr:hypothetical protein PLICRDRAFT_399302 [Plicaturopsis crispa FD-325 SS-3]